MYRQLIEDAEEVEIDNEYNRITSETNLLKEWSLARYSLDEFDETITINQIKV